MGNCVSCVRSASNCTRLSHKPEEHELTPTNGDVPLAGGQLGPVVEHADPVKPKPVLERVDSVVAAELPRPPPNTNNPLLLRVDGVDLCVQENGKAHETWNYDMMEKGNKSKLIVRRGQAFSLTLKVSRPFDVKKDMISLVFTVVDAGKPSATRGTQINVPVYAEQEDGSPEEWLAWLAQYRGTNVDIKVLSAADCIIGAWKIDVDTQRREAADAISYRLPDPIYILFNPWCKDDQVYLADSAKRQEYVCADSGLVWQGTSKSMRPVPWNFAQFEELILECALYILHTIGRVPVPRRWDPVIIARAVSAAVNAQDDNGVLVGNWSGNFVGGTPPTGWNGSMRILQQYFRNKEPVKFGQCWVFAGVTTTVCRALGIPSRVVTNFSSAHDTEASMTVDIIVDEEGNPIKELCTDSVWNFHVWNEVWMERPDLEPGGYGGWQAIDATPQERSADNQMYCLGPASMAAIKRGEVKKPFDGEFVFAEVNADQVFWRHNGDQEKMKLLASESNTIGQNISTKAVGKFEREDVTNNYKFEDDSAEERQAVSRALRQATSNLSRYYVNEEFEDIKFEINLIENVVIGRPFKITVAVSNKSKTDSHEVVVTLNLHSVLYTGVPQALVKKETFEEKIPPFTRIDFGYLVSYSEYAASLTEQGMFKASCMGRVKETDFEQFSQSDVRARKPDIMFKGSSAATVNSNLVLEVSMDNPLPVPLTKPRFSVEGPGMGPAIKVKLPEVIPVGGKARGTVTLVPRTPGEKALAASFWCSELSDVSGIFHIKVL